MDNENPNPVSPKVAWPAAVGATVTTGVWAASLAGVEVPAEVATSITTVAVFVVGFLVRDPNRS